MKLSIFLLLLVVIALACGGSNSSGSESGSMGGDGEKGAQGAVGEAEEPWAGPVMKPGFEFEVSQSTDVKGAMDFSGQKAPFQFFQKIEFTDKVMEAAGGRAKAVSRRIKCAELTMPNPYTGEAATRNLVAPGTSFKVRHGEGGSSLDSPGMEVDLARSLSQPMTPALWPEGLLEAGQAWSYSGADMVRRITLLDALEGTIDLTVERVEGEPSTGLSTAFIRGRVKCKIDFDPAPLDLDARVEIDLPQALGVPLMIKYEGKLTGKGTTQNDWGQTIPFTIQADGSALQVCKPAAAVVAAVAGGEAVPKPDSRAPAKAEGEAIPKPESQTPAPPSGNTGAGDYLAFTRVKEPNQGAFTLLIPRGWITMGGIFHVNPLEAGGPGNSVTSKCDFTVKKDDPGTVMLRYLPDMNYAFGAGVVSTLPPGSRYMGMTVSPVKGAIPFLEETFRQHRPRAFQVKIVQRTTLTSTREACNRLFAELNRNLQLLGLPPLAFDAGKIMVDYREDGMNYREELACVIVDSTGAAMQWGNARTYMARAPRAEFDHWRKVLAVTHESIKIDLNWLAREMKGQDDRARTVVETMQQIQKVDREIMANRQKTQGDIQYENYLMLTGQEDFVNPHTGEVEQDTNEYKYRWIDPDGGTVLTDDEDLDANLLFQNKSDFKRSPVRPRK